MNGDRSYFDQSPLDLFTESNNHNPYPLLTQMREQSAVFQIGSARAFQVGSYAAVMEAVKRPEDFSSHLNAMLVADQQQVSVFDLKAQGAVSQVIANADAPEHAVHRRLLMPSVKASRLAQLESKIQLFAERRLNKRSAESWDICSDFSEPLSAMVVMELLSIPESELENVQRWAMMGGDFLAGDLDPERLQTVFEETTALREFLSEHLKRIQYSDDDAHPSITQSLKRAVEHNDISEDDAVGILIVMFGAAGESTAALVASCIHYLASHEQVQAYLRAAPQHIPAFIEEIARLESPFKFHYRSVLRDTELAGQDLREGDLLMLSWAAVNRDPTVFDAPEQMRLSRTASERHLGFGQGIHFCLGAALARMEARVAIETLLKKSQSFRLAEGIEGDARYAPSIFVRRLECCRIKLK